MCVLSNTVPIMVIILTFKNYDGLSKIFRGGTALLHSCYPSSSQQDSLASYGAVLPTSFYHLNHPRPILATIKMSDISVLRGKCVLVATPFMQFIITLSTGIHNTSLFIYYLFACTPTHNSQTVVCAHWRVSTYNAGTLSCRQRCCYGDKCL